MEEENLGFRNDGMSQNVAGWLGVIPAKSETSEYAAQIDSVKNKSGYGIGSPALVTGLASGGFGMSANGATPNKMQPSDGVMQKAVGNANMLLGQGIGAFSNGGNETKLSDALQSQYEQMLNTARKTANMRMRNLETPTYEAPKPQQPQPAYQISQGSPVMFGNANVNYATVDDVSYDLGGVDVNSAQAVQQAVSNAQDMARVMSNLYENN